MKKISILIASAAFLIGLAACENEVRENDEMYETSFEESPEYLEDGQIQEADENLPVLGLGEKEVGNVELENEQTIFDDTEVDVDREGEEIEVEY